MNFIAKRLALTAILGSAVWVMPGATVLAAGVKPAMLDVSGDIVRRFDSELRANPSDAFQIFQLYLVTNPRAATALTAKFMRGRESLAPSIGAAAVVALSGSFATNEVISAQVRGIAQHISDTRPGSASDVFSTMSAAAPQFSRQIVAGLSVGAPNMASALDSIGGSPQLASADLTSGGTSEFSDPNISYGDDDPLVETLFAVSSTSSSGEESTVTVSESQSNLCLSAPCL